MPPGDNAGLNAAGAIGVGCANPVATFNGWAAACESCASPLTAVFAGEAAALSSSGTEGTCVVGDPSSTPPPSPFFLELLPPDVSLSPFSALVGDTIWGSPAFASGVSSS